MATLAATPSAPLPRRWVVWAAALSLGAAALAAFLWLWTYAPLSGLDGGSIAAGNGIVREVHAATRTGGRGKTVYFTTTRTRGRATAGFDVTNTGSFGVRLDRVVTDSLVPGVAPAIAVAGVKLSRGRATGARHDVLTPFHPVTIPPHRSVFIVVRYATACGVASDNVRTSVDHIGVRYSYLRVFHRTQTLKTPYALTLQCGGKLPASTPVP